MKKPRTKGDGDAWARRAIAHIKAHGPTTLTELVDATGGGLHQTSYNRIMRRLVDTGIVQQSGGRPYLYSVGEPPVPPSPGFDTALTPAPPPDTNGTTPADGPLVTLDVYADGVRMSHDDAIRILTAIGGTG